MTALLPTITAFGMRGLWPDGQQCLRLHAAVDHALGDGDGDGVQEREAIAMMAQVELYSRFDRDRAIEPWDLAVDSDAPPSRRWPGSTSA